MNDSGFGYCDPVLGNTLGKFAVIRLFPVKPFLYNGLGFLIKERKRTDLEEELDGLDVPLCAAERPGEVCTIADGKTVVDVPLFLIDSCVLKGEPALVSTDKGKKNGNLVRSFQVENMFLPPLDVLKAHALFFLESQKFLFHCQSIVLIRKSHFQVVGSMGRRGIIDATVCKETSNQKGRQVFPMEPVFRRYSLNAVFEDLELIPPIIKAFIPDRDSIDDPFLEADLLFIGNPRCPLIDFLQG